MAEFSGIPPVGINSIVRPAPVAPPPAVPTIEAGLKGGGLSGRMSSDTRNPPSERFFDRQGRGERTKQDQNTGPSPAFQASVLEFELDLQNTIARVEAARGKRESDIAQSVAPAAEDANRQEASDMDPAAEPIEPADAEKIVDGGTHADGAESDPDDAKG